MNIGVIGDLADTGFGRVTKEFSRRWIKAGHDLRLIGINFLGREGEVQRALEDRKSATEVKAVIERIDNDAVLSRAVPADYGGDGMGHALTAPFVTGQLCGGWKPDRLVVIADPRAMLERTMLDKGAIKTVPTWNYVPIEGSGMVPFWRTLYRHVRPVAMSRFGASELQALLGQPVPVVPHGISSAFHPFTPQHFGVTSTGLRVTSKDEAKRVFGWEGRTVILRTDRNVQRKDYPAFFAAITPIIAAHPEVLVVIHCSPIDEGGILPEHISALPGAYDDGSGWRHAQVHLTRAHDTFRGFSDPQLAVLYNAADIYASPTWAEGFGLTLLEAAASGVPVVTTDFAAGPEAVGPGGILVPPARIVPNLHGHHWSIVDVPAFTDALERLVTDKAERERLGALGAQHAKRFDWDEGARMFLELMQ